MAIYLLRLAETFMLMTESYKTFIVNHLNDNQKRQFYLRLQWESDLSKLYHELLDIHVPEEVCNDIIPQLDSSVIQEANAKAFEYFKNELTQNEVEQKLIDEGFHIGIVSNAIENYSDELSGVKVEKEKIKKNKNWSYLRLILLIAIGFSQYGKYPVWGIIIIIFAVVTFAIQVSLGDR